MKKDDSKKQPTQSKKNKNAHVKKNGPQKPGKKRPTKPSKPNQKKNQPIKKTGKTTPAKNPPNKKGPNNKGQNNKTQHKKQNSKPAKQPEIEFITKPTIEEEWTIETIERYILAVRRAFEKIPVTETKEIDLREIWMNSSLPADLILKIITDHGEKIGINKNSLFLDGKVVY